MPTIKFRKADNSISTIYVDDVVFNAHRLDEDDIYSLNAYYIIQQAQLNHEIALNEFLNTGEVVDNTLDR